jgi:hypothetical protein
MLTENGIDVDLAALGDLLRKTDVLTIGFTLLPARILVDTRSSEQQGNLATIVEPVASVQDRYLWLGRHRGAFGAPEAFSFFVWPHTVRSLLERDILAPLKARLDADAVRQLDVALSQALWRERQEMIKAVTGHESWPAIWARSESAG